ncbi:nitrogenase-associated protein [Magnetococcus marinus MC-1]|uniref:Nitrogenase-associated protein n=1 Tax=Magnetococcus marinus (strain ATCC BAA-1437 / JCM 17883 / MC-1) TaxID=156889 RepID=A0L6X6_MAGMM|nr:ArsC/Spx/MgsR family protein [Magnetococcus marinus]ABK43719.1 nitrogenase-associated protein [Magnetococcus marinus MC-1]
MAHIIFYEKPGCLNGRLQKAMLEASGHTLEVRNLLTETWQAATLRPYFGKKPVKEWFNRSAPKIKSGEVVPYSFTEKSALQAMLSDPLLIRRPLMKSGGGYMSGFEPEEVDHWIGLKKGPQPTGKPLDLESCPKGHAAEACRVEAL